MHQLLAITGIGLPILLVTLITIARFGRDLYFDKKAASRQIPCRTACSPLSGLAARITGGPPFNLAASEMKKLREICIDLMWVLALFVRLINSWVSAIQNLSNSVKVGV